jgi:hypothetical protein
MGLAIYNNFSDQCVWSSSYSGFGEWRDAIAKAAGVADWRTTVSPTADTVLGLWSTQPADPLAFVLEHSDCDGFILPYNAGRLARRLRGLLDDLAESEWLDATKDFIVALEEAFEDKATLEFM